LGLQALGVAEQLGSWADRVLDPRGAIPTGFPELDRLLRRGGLTPGSLTMWLGRTHTRKTAATLNMAANMLDAGYKVGYLSLDEPIPEYVAKMASVFLGVSHEAIEDDWEGELGERAREAYAKRADNLYLADGVRPDEDDLDAWLNYLDWKPDIVFLDYMSLVHRNNFDGAEVQRIARAAELLQTWKRRHDLALVVLHQVSKTGEASKYNDGDVPLHLASAMFGVEQVPDIVFGNYRPALNRLGNLDQDAAEMEYGDKFDEEKWSAARARVKMYQNSTFIQVLKNRPGTKLTGQQYPDIEVKSVGESQKMVTAAMKIGEEMTYDAHSG
jgi:archaellum biogenesis ATPase FlaH